MGESNWPGWLYVAAVLIPLGGFVVQFVGLRVLGRLNAYIATGSIVASFVLSLFGFITYLAVHPGMLTGGHAQTAADEQGHSAEAAGVPTDELGHPPTVWSLSTNWVALGGGMGADPNSPALTIPLGIHIDGLAVIMFLMVTFVAALIHIYSMGYMSDDPGYPRFFAFLSLFSFSMLGLVASASIFMVFIFWELVGVCSYLLIGFWYQEKANCDAANKAFIVNRVGDIGMLVGLGILWTHLGTFDINVINRGIRDDAGRLNATASAAGEVYQLRDRETHNPQLDAATGLPRQIPAWLLTLAGLGVFAGCVGKSAQFPLHVWLPDAMAGPTPVSALIHAATMVAAGVYLVGRFFPVFTPLTLEVIAYTGGFTLFLAATIACVQTDYKKVLAYSTVSQLGLMMLGLGVGGWAAGLFHLLTHAFFKALLFLGAGSVYHAVHTYELPRLGGLWKKMPITAGTMLLATLAISGVPIFSGFYSKDAVLAAVVGHVEHHAADLLLLVFMVVGATLTAFYMFRMWLLLFTGTSRSADLAAAGQGQDHDPDHAHDHGDPVAHAHESPKIMTVPLIALAVPTVLVGLPLGILPIVGGTPILENMLAYGAPVPLVHHAGAVAWTALGLSLLIAGVGIATAFAFYFWRVLDPAAAAQRLGSGYVFFKNKWYFDELYDRVFVQPVLWVGRRLADFDRNVIDGFLDGTARATADFSRLNGGFDLAAIDGAVNAVGRVTYTIGDWGRRLQNGHLRSYLMVLAVGLVVLFLGIARWIQTPG